MNKHAERKLSEFKDIYRKTSRELNKKIIRETRIKSDKTTDTPTLTYFSET
jgi:hypothetical protein